MWRSVGGTIAALALAVMPFVASSGAREVPTNPYTSLYERSLAGMARPDQTFDGVLAPDAPVEAVAISAPIAQSSKTCSQRCSTRCSTSCTTTRGCSTQCKVQTDGCGGTVTRPTPPSTRATAALPESTADPLVYVPDGSRIYHASMTCPYIQAGRKLVAKNLSELADGFSPCDVCKPAARQATISAARALSSTAPTGYFALGSTGAEVRSIQGAPSSVIGDTWSYDHSIIWFRENRVVGYSDVSGNLKVHLGNKTNPSGSIGIGSTKAEVLAVHGTPTSVIGETWNYDHSIIWFDGDRVRSYSNISGNLRIR